MIRGILFDKDGTLVDYTATWAPINVAAAHYAAVGDRDLAQRLLRIGGHDSETGHIVGGSLLAAAHTIEIAEAWREVGSPIEMTELTRELDRIFTAGADDAVAVPGVVQFFQALKDIGIRTGVATSDSAGGAWATLSTIGLAEQVDFVAGYDSGHGGKPAPGMAQAFLDSARLDADECMMVGDNLHDIRTGRAAGFSLCVGVLTGTGSRADLETEADHVISDVTAIPTLLREIGRWPAADGATG